MKRSGNQSIGQFLRGIKSGRGQSLPQTLAAHQALEKRLLRHLPMPVREHCRLGQIRDNTLIIFVDSAAWATRLRFMATQIVKQLQRDDSVTLNRLEVRILPQNMPSTSAAPVRAPARLSVENANLISSLARGVDDDKLSRALQRLASRSKKEHP